ncbi:MAG: hypothetical protein WKF37_17650, partial [Bryobacteraceae bacterium]
VYMWSGGIQRQLSQSWLLEALYQGSAGVGLLNSWDINAIPLDISRDVPTLNAIANASQNFRPFTQFGTIRHYSNYGHNTHHSGTLRFERRASTGVPLNAFTSSARPSTTQMMMATRVALRSIIDRSKGSCGL